VVAELINDVQYLRDKFSNVSVVFCFSSSLKFQGKLAGSVAWYFQLHHCMVNVAHRELHRILFVVVGDYGFQLITHQQFRSYLRSLQNNLNH